jgi:hypothetical protein
VLKLIGIVLVSVIVVACSQEARTPQFGPTQMEFGPRTPFVKLDHGDFENLKIEKYFEPSKDKPVLAGSESIFSFIEQLYVLRENETDFEFRQQTANLINESLSAFYSDKKNYTEFGVEESPFLELALYIFRDQLYEELAKNMGESIEIVKKVTSRYERPNSGEMYIDPDWLMARSNPEYDLSPIKKKIRDLEQEIFRAECQPNEIPTMGMPRVALVPQQEREGQPARAMGLYKELLVEITNGFEKEGMIEGIVEPMREELRQNIFPELDKFVMALKVFDKDLSLPKKIKKLSKALDYFTLIPTDVMEEIQREINNGMGFADGIANAECADDLIVVLVDLWMYLDPEIRGCLFYRAEPRLYEVFAEIEEIDRKAGNTNNESLIWIKTGTDHGYQWLKKRELSTILLKLRLALSSQESEEELAEVADEDRGVVEELWRRARENDVVDGPLRGVRSINDDDREYLENSKKIVAGAINDFMKLELEKRILAEIHRVPSVVKKMVVEEIVAMDSGAQKDVHELFRKIGREEIGKAVFSEDVETLPAVELSHVALLVDPQQGLVTRRYLDKKDAELVGKETQMTTAETLGASLNLAATRLQWIREVEGMSEDHPDFFRLVYSHVNKLIAMIGYRNLDGVLSSSYCKKMIGESKGEIGFDIYAYDKHRAFYAIPDRLRLDKGFLLDASSDAKPQLIAGVKGQAELIRAASKFLRYFSDWNTSAYDSGMGSYEVQGNYVFPKQAFLDLSLGLGSIGLRNLEREGLLMFNAYGQLMKLDELETKRTLKMPQDNSKTAVSAVLADVSTNGSQPVIKTQALASYVEALEEFMDASQGIEKSQSRLMQTTDDDGERIYLNAINDGKQKVEMLIIGIGNILVSKLQDADGGMSSKYYVDSKSGRHKRVDAARELEEQLLAIKALLTVHERWGGELYRFAAIDILHYLNANLWSAQDGFYLEKESGEVCRDPRIFVLAINVFEHLYEHLPKNEKPQMRSFLDAAKVKWTEFHGLRASQ